MSNNEYSFIELVERVGSGLDMLDRRSNMRLESL